MADLFSAYEVQDPGATLHAYLFESTAPDNIDDPVNTPDLPRKTVKISAAEAVEKIASALRTSLKTSINPPSLIISIHGFNNPRDVILKGYWNSFGIPDLVNLIRQIDKHLAPKEDDKENRACSCLSLVTAWEPMW
jgi:hypothetical protein